jgi:hypothetical protein
MARSKRFQRPQIVSVRKMTDQECQRYFGKTLAEARSEKEEMDAHRQIFLDRCEEADRKAKVRITYRIAEYDR